MYGRFIRRRILWLGLVAVLLPLAVLLGLQWAWLVELQAQSAVARTVYLENYREAVSSRIEYFYRQQAERALNLPEHLLLQDDTLKVVQYFMKKEPLGAKLVFLVNFARNSESWKEILLYDPESEVFGKPKKPEMAQAITMALAPWRGLHAEGGTLQTFGLTVEEQDPHNRIVLNPIADAEGKVLGIAGMIVDEGYFIDEVLPTAIHDSLPKSLDEQTAGSLLYTVRDAQGQLLRGTDPGPDVTLPARGRLRFIFTDWELALGSSGASPEEWARSNFLYNITLSALLAAALLGGILLALRAASRAMRLSEMKSEFVSNVSHELRTPLASVRVLGEFLRLGRVADPAKVREYGEHIENQCRRLSALIDNILDFSRIESGAKTYRFLPTDVTALVERTLRPLQPGFEHAGIEVALDVASPAGLPPMSLDPDAIAQALINLVDNAAKHSRPPARIRVGVAGDRDEVRIAVEDHGVGIPRREQRRIFERFHRVSTGLVHDVKGSGLGLSIVDHIVRAHGGRIRVDSEVGRGSTFTIHLPVRPEHAEES